MNVTKSTSTRGRSRSAERRAGIQAAGLGAAAGLVCWAAMLLSGCTPEREAAVAATDRSAATEPARSRKRSAPAPLSPVTQHGIRYTELRAGRGRGLAQNGGYVVATDIASGAELWFVPIYAETGDKNIEADKRDVYITRLSLAAGGDSLLIENERGERYALSLKDRSVRRLTP